MESGWDAARRYPGQPHVPTNYAVGARRQEVACGFTRDTDPRVTVGDGRKQMVEGVAPGNQVGYPQAS